MLRSMKELRGYSIHATDGDIGSVHGFYFDDHYWTIRYLVVDTRNWLPGKKVLIASDWIKQVSWPGEAYVDMTRKQIEDSPEFDPSAPVNREYEERLYDFYGRAKYWGKNVM